VWIRRWVAIESFQHVRWGTILFMSKAVQHPDGSTSFDGPRGTVTVQRLGPGCLHMTIRGHMTVDCYEAVITLFDTEVQTSSKLIFFVDGAAFDSYDQAFRTRWAEWLLKHRKTKQVAAHILVTSSVVALGVTLVNVATGGALTSYTQAAAFEAALSRYAPASALRKRA
jgi:hypothetical protein